MEKRLLLALSAMLAAAILLTACASRLEDGAIILDPDDSEDSPRLRVVDVERRALPKEQVQFDLGTGEVSSDEEVAESGAGGDYLVITFEVDNPSENYDRTFMPSDIAIGWGDEYNTGTGAPAMVDIASSSSEQFEQTFLLARAGTVDAVTGPGDVTVFMSDDGPFSGLPITGDPGKMSSAEEMAEFSASLAELWDGEF